MILPDRGGINNFRLKSASLSAKTEAGRGKSKLPCLFQRSTVREMHEAVVLDRDSSP